jgi:hypothetical protein
MLGDGGDFTIRNGDFPIFPMVKWLRTWADDRRKGEFFTMGI